MRIVLALVGWAISGVLTYAGEPSFSGKPIVANDGGMTKVSFSVSAPTDVEVAVLSTDGKIVRHLAAGVLGGKNPPPEPLKAGLSQSLVWDGKDDIGKPIAGGPFKIRVRAGMGIKFGRMIGGDPSAGMVSEDSGAPFEGLAADADGNVYVKTTCFRGGLHNGIPWQVRKFDKFGKYLKTLLPYPPSTPPAKATGFRQIDAGDSLLTPANDISSMYPIFFAFGDNIFNKISDGSIVFIDNPSCKLTFFKLDGSNAVKTIPMWNSSGKPKWQWQQAPQMAFSPDGKYAYYSNGAVAPQGCKKPSDIDPKFPQGRIYRKNLTNPGSDPETFYDLELPDWEKAKYWMPFNGYYDRKTAAAGIAVDAQGHVFVCDLVNQEVVELSPEGKKISSFKVPWPDKVLVSSKTGSLYVISTQISRDIRLPSEVLKFTGRGEQVKLAARVVLRGALGQSAALDDSGDAPVLWLGGRGEVVRVEDRGAMLVAGENILNRDKNATPLVLWLAVDSEADLLYLSNSSVLWRYNGETGDGGPTPITTADVAIGPNGMVYAWGAGGYDGPVCRYDRDLKPAPLAATGENKYGRLWARMGKGNSIGGMAVDPRGWVYGFYSVGGPPSYWPSVAAYDADGKPVQSENGLTTYNSVSFPVLIAKASDAGGGIRVDAGGNIYLGQLGYPKDHQAPKGFEKDECYKSCGGSIIKFGPKGGEGSHPNEPGTILGFKGALQAYPGLAPMSRNMSGGGCCACCRPRFDLDGFGRLYIPNALTYKVSVVDNAGNEIMKFGGYGNFDAQGPKSSEPKPEIPMGWPVAVGASDKYIYVGDQLNCRAVRADKTWAVESECSVR